MEFWSIATLVVCVACATLQTALFAVTERKAQELRAQAELTLDLARKCAEEARLEVSQAVLSLHAVHTNLATAHAELAGRVSGMSHQIEVSKLRIGRA